MEITEQTKALDRTYKLNQDKRGSVCFPNKILKDPICPVRTFRLLRYFRFFRTLLLLKSRFDRLTQYRALDRHSPHAKGGGAASKSGERTGDRPQAKGL